jgi:hypothetical protein
LSPRLARQVTVCGHCGQPKKCPRVILGEAVCSNCVLRFQRAPKVCPGCSETKVLAFFDTDRRAACAKCCGAASIYGCAECGREDSPFGTRCAPCVLRERVGALLAGPDAAVHPLLQPVFDALTTTRRPLTTLYWLTRSTGPTILGSMASGEVEISHAAFDQLPADKATRYVHELLAALGVLTPFNSRLEQITPWLTQTLRPLPKDQADIIGRFAQWHVIRGLRHQDQSGTLTPSSIENGRAAIITAIRLLAWLEDRHKTLATLTQTDLDHYLTDHPGRGEILVAFIAWTRQANLTSGLQMPKWRRGPPEVVLSDSDRWAAVETLLHDNTIRLYVRVAGLLTLLFAQPLTRICRMKADQIEQHPGGTTTVTFDKFAIELPDPLDQLVINQLAYRGQASYSNQPGVWLFPGANPGKHLGTESVRVQLVAQGIQPSHARKSAMFQLAAEIPTPVLADILGLATSTATRWAALAARDWSYYTAQRHQTRQR